MPSLNIELQMIQAHKEGLFQKIKIQKIATIIILTVKGMFQHGQRYPSISMRGKARSLDVRDASRKIATSLKTLMKESTQQKNPSLAHHQTNVTMRKMLSILWHQNLPDL